MFPYDNNEFNEDGSVNEAYCPSPEYVVAEYTKQIAQYTRAAICTESEALQNTINTEVNRIVGEIDAIKSIDGIQSSLQELKNFLDSADLNGDGQLDELVTAFNKADQALALAQQNQGLINGNATEIQAAKDAAAAVGQELSDYKLFIEPKIQALQDRVTQLETRATNLETFKASAESTLGTHTTKITSLEEKVADIEAAGVTDNRCEIYKGLKKGFDAAAAAFGAELAKGCPVETEAPEDGGGDNTPPPGDSNPESGGESFPG